MKYYVIADDVYDNRYRVVVGRQEGYDDPIDARRARDSVTPVERRPVVVREPDELELMTLAERAAHRRKLREWEERRREVTHLRPDGRLDMDGLRSLPPARLFRASNGTADYVIVPATEFDRDTETIEAVPSLWIEWARRNHVAKMDDGTPVVCVSLNGAGEIRWTVDPVHPSPYDREAMEYFRLTPVE
jgi:hypothetical protein